MEITFETSKLVTVNGKWVRQPTSVTINSEDVAFFKAPINPSDEGRMLGVLVDGPNGAGKEYSIPAHAEESLLAQFSEAKLPFSKFNCNIVRDGKHVPKGVAFINVKNVTGVYFPGGLTLAQDIPPKASVEFGPSYDTIVLGRYKAIRDKITEVRCQIGCPKAEIC